jgi:hypothetical protein
MAAAVELEIERTLGLVTTRGIGEKIQRVADALSASARDSATREAEARIVAVIDEQMARHPRHSPITAYEVLGMLKSEIVLTGQRRGEHRTTAVPERDGWHSMSGLPKDGRPFDVWASHRDDSTGRRLADCRLMKWEEGVVEVTDEVGRPLERVLGYVLHKWRPLPAPPHPEGEA